MHEILGYITTAVSFICIAIILYGTIKAVAALVYSEFKGGSSRSIAAIRATFGGYLLLGLEILIAADIVKTIVEPSYEELVVLAGIVAIRTIMSVFLNREIKELKEEETKKA